MKSLRLIVLLMCVASSVLALPPEAFQSQLKASRISSGGVLIAYEGFDYTADSTIKGSNGGTGWTNAWSTALGAFGLQSHLSVVSPGLTYLDLPTTGNQLRISGSDSSALRSIAPLGADGSTIWVSFLGLLPGNIYYGNLNSFNLLDGTTVKVTVDNGVAGPGEARSIRLVVDGTASTPSPAIPSSPQHLYVLRIDFAAGGDDVRLFVDPVISAGEPLNSTAKASVLGQSFTFDKLRLTGGFGGLYSDEVRIATTWKEAVGQ